MLLFSVILTTYNSEKFLQRTLDSIRNQEGINEKFKIELIVVDDCSTDKTHEILNKNNVPFYTTEINSGGPNRGRNIGLNLATGDYICLMDHDDEWISNRILAVLPFLHLAPIITSGYSLSYPGKTSLQTRINPQTRKDQEYKLYKINETFINKLTKAADGQQTYLGSIIIHKDLRHILFEEYFGAVDFDWGLKLFYNRTSVEICKPLYIRHVGNNNLSLNEQYRLKDFQYSLQVIKEYEKLYPRETKIAFRKIHGSLARYYYVMRKMNKARHYFIKSERNIKTLLYYLTTFAGASFVIKNFKVFQ